MQDKKQQEAEAIKKQEAEHQKAVQNLAETLKTRNADKNHITLSDLKTLKNGEEIHKSILKNRSNIDKMRRNLLGIEERLSKSETKRVLKHYGVGTQSKNERAL